MRRRTVTSNANYPSQNLSAREQAAVGRLAHFSGGRIANYEGGAKPGYGGPRVAGYGGTYGALTGMSSEKEIFAFQGLLTYAIQVVNANAAVRTFRLTPGLLGFTAAGLIAAGAFNDINGDAGLTGSTTSFGSIATLQQFIAYNPTKLLGMKVSSTVEEQGELTINVYPKSPFRQLESKVLPIGQYNDGDTFNDKKTFMNLIPYDMQLDMQVDIQIPVYGTSTLNLLLFLGPILNPAQILDAKTSGM